MFGIVTAKEGALPFCDLCFRLKLIGAGSPERGLPGVVMVRRSLVRLEPLISDVKPLDGLRRRRGLGSGGQRMKIVSITSVTLQN
jgi:hypothetical protein